MRTTLDKGGSVGIDTREEKAEILERSGKSWECESCGQEVSNTLYPGEVDIVAKKYVMSSITIQNWIRKAVKSLKP